MTCPHTSAWTATGETKTVICNGKECQRPLFKCPKCGIEATAAEIRVGCAILSPAASAATEG